ncbi:serine protease 27-like isoform X2 [Phymastichus coffea]|uniref:serine protease 27-like isoform X2 n=1 Tax=Phymastichus coffea TaxID=108790 RepID=UPI00273B33CB|nr:serine protease 27-like isoform X2 [Phymastichus coffea]
MPFSFYRIYKATWLINRQMSRISCVIVMCPLLLANALAFRDDLLSAFTDRDSPARPKRILNGEAVRMNREIKYQVLIRGKPKGKFVCGGSIIGEQSVLTAAHCLVNNENETFMELPPVILAGITNARAKQHGHYFKSDVIKAYIPKDFKWQDQETASIADIAVLKLQHNFGRRYYLSKINLPAVNMTKSYDGIRALVTGYGYDDIECNAGDEDANCKWSWSGQLNKMIVRIITSEESDSLLDYCKPREKFICAVIDPRYESGGPCSSRMVRSSSGSWAIHSSGNLH